MSGDLTARPSEMPLGEAADFDGGAAGARRVTTFNVPVGDSGYVERFLNFKASGLVSNNNIIDSKLQARSHGQFLWPMFLKSLCHCFDYWVQHCPPSATAAAAANVDTSLMKLAGTALRQDFTSPGAVRALARLRLPVRDKGGGIRSLGASAPAAFVGAISSVRCGLVH